VASPDMSHALSEDRQALSFATAVGIGSPHTEMHRPRMFAYVDISTFLNELFLRRNDHKSVRNQG
jgi:hypothetical protein